MSSSTSGEIASGALAADDVYEEFDEVSPSVLSACLDAADTDEDGFRTIVLRDDTINEATTHDDTRHGEDDEDDEDDDEEDESISDPQDGDEEDEFPDIDRLTGVTSHAIAPPRPPRAQIGGGWEYSSSSEEDEDEDEFDRSASNDEEEEDVEVTVERFQRDPTSSFAPAFAGLRPALSQHATSAAPPGDSFNELRAMLETDVSGSLSRLRSMVAARAAQAEQEAQAPQPVELLDLLQLVPTTEEKEAERTPAKVRAIAIEPLIAQPQEDDDQNDEAEAQFRVDAALLATELLDSEDEDARMEAFILRPSELSEAAAHTSQPHFSNLASLSASASTSTQAASTDSATSRSRAYAAAGTASGASTAAPAAPVASSGLPSAAVARTGLLISSPSSASTRAAGGPGAPPRTLADGPSLFTSEALSFLNITPDRARKLHAAFAAEQAVFNHRHEHTLPPDAETHLIDPVGRDQLDPSHFRS